MTEKLKIAGLRLVVEGAAEFNNTISQVNSKVQLSNAEFAKLQAQYGNNSKSVELLAGKQKLLQDKLQAAKDIGTQYNRILEETVSKYGENSIEANKVRVAIAKNEAEQVKLEKQLAAVSKELEIQSSAWTQVGTKLESVSTKLRAVGDKMTSVGKTMSMAITAPLAAAGTAAFKFAADLQDAMGASDQIFKGASDDIKSWADGLESYYGIAESQALSYANTMGAMLQNIGGLSEEEAAKQSAMLVELAGDLTAMFGGTTESAVQALTGALKGNNSMLDNYGMGVNEATIKTKALEMGLIAEGEQLDLASKQAATLEMIMEQTADAQGQAAREAGGASGAWRAFQTEIKNLATDIGEVFLPTITPLITKLKEITQRFSELPEATKKNIVMFAGVAAAIGPALVIFGKITTGIGSLVGVLGKASLAVGGLIGGVGSLGSAISALAGPVGIAVAALGLLVLACLNSDSEYGKLVNTLKKAEKSWKRITKAKEEAFAKGAEEITDIQTLKLELDSLVDANGRVKEGYEDRVAYIASELSEATSIEINLVDGVIQSYDELGAAIDKYISKRRAEIALETGEEAYKAAVQGRKDIEGAYLESYNAMLKAQDDYNSHSAGRSQQRAADELNRATELYEGLKTQYEEYGKEIKAYEADLTAFRNGEYDSVASGLSGLLVSMEQFTAMSKEEQEKQVEKTRKSLEEKTQLYLLNGEETTKIQLNALAEQLANEDSYLSSRQNNLVVADAEYKEQQTETNAEIIAANSKLQSNLTAEDMAGANVREREQAAHYSRLQNNQNGNLSAMQKAIADKQPGMVSATRTVTSAIYSEVDKTIQQAQSWGEKLIQGFIEGINERREKVQETVARVMEDVGDFMKFRSPAKKGEGRYIVKWGENMVKGFIQGMEHMRSSLGNAAASMSSVAVSGIASNTDNRSYSYGGVTVQNMVVRSENDIKSIAQELYRLQVKDARGKGVLV